MDKIEYIRQLEKRLSVLPEADRRDAVEYYAGYIDDAGDEYAAISRLGSPGEVAAIILAQHVVEEPSVAHKPKETGSFKAIWITLLALFSLPVGIGVLGAAFGLIIALLAVVFSIGITGGSFIAAGVVVIFASISTLWQGFAVSLMNAGVGFILVGVGIPLLMFNIFLVKTGFRFISRFVGRSILRRGRHAQ